MNVRIFSGIVLVLIAALALDVRVARAHGFSLSLAGSDLVATSSSTTSDGNPFIFIGEQVSDSGLGLEADHGFAGGGAAFVVGKHFSFSTVGPLWYSNGGAAEPAAPGVVMELIGQQAGFPGLREMSGTTAGVVPGFAVTGRTSHELIWRLLIDTSVPGHVSAIPDGVYGVAYFLTGGSNSGDTYTPTELLVNALTTEGFDPNFNNPNVDPAGIAIYSAAVAVPEPSSLALAGLGLVALVPWARRRLRCRG